MGRGGLREELLDELKALGVMSGFVICYISGARGTYQAGGRAGCDDSLGESCHCEEGRGR